MELKRWLEADAAADTECRRTESEARDNVGLGCCRIAVGAIVAGGYRTVVGMLRGCSLEVRCHSGHTEEGCCIVEEHRQSRCCRNLHTGRRDWESIAGTAGSGQESGVGCSVGPYRDHLSAVVPKLESASPAAQELRLGQDFLRYGIQVGLHVPFLAWLATQPADDGGSSRRLGSLKIAGAVTASWWGKTAIELLVKCWSGEIEGRPVTGFESESALRAVGGREPWVLVSYVDAMRRALFALQRRCAIGLTRH